MRLFAKKDNLFALKHAKRYVPGVYKNGSLTLQYCDALSFYYEYRDIFMSKIYHFNSESKTPIIIDAGGYIGLTTLYYKQVYPNANITVFEPDPYIYNILERNIRTNNTKNVSLFNQGLGVKNGILPFYPDGADGGTIHNAGQSRQIEVEIVKLSDYINKPIDMLKMNIEGMEKEVFEDIEKKLHFINEIIFEYHFFHNLPQSLGHILQILDRQGFRYLISDATSSKVTIPFSIKNDYRQFAIVYAKRWLQ